MGTVRAVCVRTADNSSWVATPTPTPRAGAFAGDPGTLIPPSAPGVLLGGRACTGPTLGCLCAAARNQASGGPRWGAAGAGSGICLLWEGRAGGGEGCGQPHLWVVRALGSWSGRPGQTDGPLGGGWGCFPDAPDPGLLLGWVGWPPAQTHGCARKGRDQGSRNARLLPGPGEAPVRRGSEWGSVWGAAQSPPGTMARAAHTGPCCGSGTSAG